MAPRYWIAFSAAALLAQPALGTPEQLTAPAKADITVPFQGAERAGSKPSAFAGRQEFDVTGAARMRDPAVAAGASPLVANDTRATDVGGTAGEGADGAVGGAYRDSHR